MDALPLYRRSAKAALLAGEVELWKQSHALNLQCCQAIDEERARSANQNNALPKELAVELAATYGLDRVLHVLSHQMVTGDGRVGKDVVGRALQEHYPDDRHAYYVCNTHPGILDMLYRDLMELEGPGQGYEQITLAGGMAHG